MMQTILQTSWWNPHDWFNDFMSGVAGWFSDKYEELLKFIVKTIFQLAIPVPQTFSSAWFTAGAGGFLGLSLILWKFIVIVIAFISVVTSLRRKMSEKQRMRLSRVMSSVFVLSLFSFGFYPAYGILYNLDKQLNLVMIHWVTGKPTGDLNAAMQELFSVALPSEVAATIMSAGASSIFGLAAMCEALTMYTAVLVLLMVYPLIVALRPVGKRMNDIFNGANSAILVCLLSPPLMTACFLLPVMISKIPVIGVVSAYSTLAAVIGGLAACVLPAVLAWFFFNKSSEIFGFTDTSMAGAMDIGSMPPVTTRAMQESVTDVHQSAIGEFAKGVAGGIPGAALMSDSPDEFLGNMKNVAIDAAGVALTGGGHAVLGAMVNLANDKKPSKDKGST